MFPPAERNNAKMSTLFKINSVRCNGLEVTENIQQVAGCLFDLRSPFSLKSFKLKEFYKRAMERQEALPFRCCCCPLVKFIWLDRCHLAGLWCGWAWAKVLSSVQVQAVSLCTPSLSCIYLHTELYIYVQQKLTSALTLSSRMWHITYNSLTCFEHFPLIVSRTVAKLHITISQHCQIHCWL